MTPEQEERMALYALQLGYANMLRATKTTKAMEMERLLLQPHMTFTAKPVPGWVYYPGTDTVQRIA